MCCCCAANFVGIAVPYIYFGGIGPMFAALVHARPQHLLMPGATKNLGHGWYFSTVLLTSLGFYMWPQAFAASFTAKSGNTLRRNAVIMPLYSITMPLMFCVGLTAILVLPGLSNGDLSLLTLVRKTFPAWFLGAVGGAGALTAMVPAAIQILTAATLFAKNVYRPIFAPGMSDHQVARLAKTMVLFITATALGFAIYSSTTLVSLLLLGYDGVTQFFPGVVLGLYSRHVTKLGVLTGLIVGITVVSCLVLSHRDPFFGLNAGLVALALNFAVTAAVSFLTSAQTSSSDQSLPAAAIAGSGHIG